MGDRQRSASTSGECPKEGWGGRILAGFGGLTVGVLGGVLAVALSPVGETLREWWSPTVANVSGIVVKDGAGIWAQVRLDSAGENTAVHAVDVTDDWGGFGFDNVARGPHSIFILEDGNTVSYHREFTIGIGERAKELGDMDLAVAQPRLRPLAGQDAGDAVEQDAGDDADEDADGESPVLVASPVAASFPEETMVAALPSPSPSPAPASNAYEAWLATMEAESTDWSSPVEPDFSWSPIPAGSPAASEDPASAVEIVVDSAPLPGENRLSGLPLDARRVSIHVAGPFETLLLIERVTYTLSASFNPNIVTRYDVGDGFRLSLDTGETTIEATIFFADGTTVDHVIPVEL